MTGQVQTDEVEVDVEPLLDALGHLGQILVDQFHQSDLAIGSELGHAILDGGNGGDVSTGGCDLVDQRQGHILLDGHEVGNGLTQNGVQSDQDGQGDHGPQAAAHGVDALFLIKLLDFLVGFCLVVGILFPDLIHLTGHAVHADHVALGLHLEGQHNQLDHNGKQNDRQTVRACQIVKQSDQSRKRHANVVTQGLKHTRFLQFNMGSRKENLVFSMLVPTGGKAS